MRIGSLEIILTLYSKINLFNMPDLIRLIISDKRLKDINRKNLELTSKESHYLNQVMRIKFGQKIFILNGKGSLWEGKLIEKNSVEVINYDSPLIKKDEEKIKLGLAVVLPKNGFDDILKMSTEIGIDIIQPLYSDRQVKKKLNYSEKQSRWDSIINESVEQCERLWKPILLDCINVKDWFPTLKTDYLSISVTRDRNCQYLKKWLEKLNLKTNKGNIIWNAIGPEGGWSYDELEKFKINKVDTVKLSETILRTSTAAVNASTILNYWRDEIKEFKIN